jgi:hypothetical protein
MSTTLVALLIALAGVVGVLAVASAFYLVGRAEDRERAAAARARGNDAARGESPREDTAPASEPAPGETPEPGAIARARSRARPPRRPG